MYIHQFGEERELVGYVVIIYGHNQKYEVLQKEKVPGNCPGLSYFLPLRSSAYFFFLAAFFLGAAFLAFLAAFFLVAMFL